ncbi:hypothetical protein PBI_GAIA_4 [Mycobacterium phage Gaia]|uniref:Scaffolding protein n=1 Tax=Mycobacterium phage Gaia TaxID=1486472 RepID=A0A068F2C4_9CAUD|nr:head scaffolding protein [Mycobacterium phage Gaia]AID58824.1 hypothetical protein PBI_GAIA_4 [Mycobacterium phage Gaia]AYQ99946.1 scaffolding protein [Mycobacterium phage Nebkiss]
MRENNFLKQECKLPEIEETVTTETVEQEPSIVAADSPEEEPTPKPTETVEFWKQKAREQEKRAKANAAAQEALEALKAEQAKALEELEAFRAEKLTQEERDAQQREKEAQEKADAIRERDAARQEALRWRIAAKHGITDEDAELFLTGTDEETLTKQAERFTSLQPKPGKGNVIPSAGQQPKEPPSLAEQIRLAEEAKDVDTAMRLKAQQLAALAQNNV